MGCCWLQLQRESEMRHSYHCRSARLEGHILQMAGTEWCSPSIGSRIPLQELEGLLRQAEIFLKWDSIIFHESTGSYMKDGNFEQENAKCEKVSEKSNR